MLGQALGFLFHGDEAELAIVQDDIDDRLVIADGSDEIGHQHGDAAITGDRADRAVGIGEFGTDRAGRGKGHAGQGAGQGEALVRSDDQVARSPGGRGAGIDGVDRVVRS